VKLIDPTAQNPLGEKGSGQGDLLRSCFVAQLSSERTRVLASFGSVRWSASYCLLTQGKSLHSFLGSVVSSIAMTVTRGKMKHVQEPAK
jgi:hypothetical protein